MTEAITNIPLSDQIIAILRVRRIASIYAQMSSEQLATQLDRTKSEIVMCLHGMYEAGKISRTTVLQSTTYAVAPDSRQTKGCCACCDGKLFDSTRLFCETCGPEFSGRV